MIISSNTPSASIIPPENPFQEPLPPIERIEDVASKHLFETRYYQPHPWPKDSPTASLDCEGFAHYLMKGIVSKFGETEILTISKVGMEKKHLPYSCYKIFQPTALWARKEMGFWGPVHFFTHLENGKYISKNGLGPIRIFDSFEKMLKQDAFPFGFVTEDYHTTNDIEQAMIGEAMIGRILSK